MKFEPFERDSKHSNGNAYHSKDIRSILIQILTIRKKFEAFKCKFEPFERVSKHSNEIRAIRKGFKAFKWKPFERYSKHSNSNSNHSKEIRSIQMQIRTIRKGLEALELNFEPFEMDSKH